MQDDTLARALADVRQRLNELQSEYDRVATELGKLRQAEKSLAALVEGVAEGDVSFAGGFDGAPAPGRAPAARASSGRGSRGPRANSAKGRLKVLLEEAGPQGYSQADIQRRLHDVAPATLNTYLSMMVSGGEAVRNGDFYTARKGPIAPDAPGDEEEEAPDHDAADPQDEE
ncbi:hypothetical protein LKMONMHP_3737 [Methylobacterium organophilum]|uniref:HTH iclR-type domain-containing protein n=2 Tax=Methylobacterium organophilum TaxID=410 RepID=A0ABQ4TB92_METOR|nr:hypothetical protein LKMONMHP_3737 [Methylobacterium organophilum]